MRPKTNEELEQAVWDLTHPKIPITYRIKRIATTAMWLVVAFGGPWAIWWVVSTLGDMILLPKRIEGFTAFILMFAAVFYCCSTDAYKNSREWERRTIRNDVVSLFIVFVIVSAICWACGLIPYHDN